jgi:hypothetical protein
MGLDLEMETKVFLSPIRLLSMDQRREARFAANQPITVKLLGKDARTETATVKNASSRGLAIELQNPIAPCTALRIEMEDSFVLGEAVYCRREPDGWLVGVELDQMLCGLSALGRKLQEFAHPQNVRTAGDQRPERPPVPAP